MACNIVSVRSVVDDPHSRPNCTRVLLAPPPLTPCTFTNRCLCCPFFIRVLFLFVFSLLAVRLDPSSQFTHAKHGETSNRTMEDLCTRFCAQIVGLGRLGHEELTKQKEEKQTLARHEAKSRAESCTRIYKIPTTTSPSPPARQGWRTAALNVAILRVYPALRRGVVYP